MGYGPSLNACQSLKKSPLRQWPRPASTAIARGSSISASAVITIPARSPRARATRPSCTMRSASATAAFDHRRRRHCPQQPCQHRPGFRASHLSQRAGCRARHRSMEIFEQVEQRRDHRRLRRDAAACRGAESPARHGAGGPAPARPADGRRGSLRRSPRPRAQVPAPRWPPGSGPQPPPRPARPARPGLPAPPPVPGTASPPPKSPEPPA